MGNGLEYDVSEALHMLDASLEGVSNGKYDSEKLSPYEVDNIRSLLASCRVAVELLQHELPVAPLLSIGEWRRIAKSQVEEC